MAKTKIVSTKIRSDTLNLVRELVAEIKEQQDLTMFSQHDLLHHAVVAYKQKLSSQVA